MTRILILLFFFTRLTATCYSQSIIAFTVSPSNPTSADTITVVVECMFPSGDCDGTASLTSITGDHVYASAHHCMGMLTVICTDYDTVIIPPLPQGQYTFSFILNTGDGFPCIPGTVPMIFDSVTIDVSNINGIKNVTDIASFHLVPNPSKDRFTLRQDNMEQGTLKIYSMDGKLVQLFHVTEKETEINHGLAQGLYSIIIENEGGKYFTKLNVVK